MPKILPLKSCCYGLLSLRKGTLLIVSIDLLEQIIHLVLICYAHFSEEDYFLKVYTYEFYRLIITVAGLITCLCVLIGEIANTKCCMIPWIFTTVITIITYFVRIIYVSIKHDYTSLWLYTVAEVVAIYFLMVVLSYFLTADDINSLGRQSSSAINVSQENF